MALLACASAAPMVTNWAAAMLTAPAAEVPRKPRRVGDGDLADMVMLRAYTFVCGTNRLEWIDGSAKGESKGLHARIEKLDLE